MYDTWQTKIYDRSTRGKECGHSTLPFPSHRKQSQDQNQIPKANESEKTHPIPKWLRPTTTPAKRLIPPPLYNSTSTASPSLPSPASKPPPVPFSSLCFHPHSHAPPSNHLVFFFPLVSASSGSRNRRLREGCDPDHARQGCIWRSRRRRFQPRISRSLHRLP